MNGLSKLKFIPPDSIKSVQTHEQIVSAIRRDIPRGPVPIIPKKNGCCINVCKELNNKINKLSIRLDYKEDELKRLAKGTHKRAARSAAKNVMAQITSLKDHRVGLREKNICKCIAYQHEIKEYGYELDKPE